MVPRHPSPVLRGACCVLGALVVHSAWSAEPTASPPTSAPGSAPASAPAGVVEELWAGHQIIVGSRPLPVFGEIETRGESFVLARARIQGDRIELTQWPCVFRFQPVLGVGVRMTPAAMASLPRARIRFERVGSGSDLVARPWVVQWDREDLDRDGHPGVTVQVDNAFCDGQVYTANQSTSEATATRLADGLEGKISVATREHVHGASRLCLKAGSSSDREELQRGRFRYRRVPDGTRCQDLPVESWPVQVTLEPGAP